MTYFYTDNSGNVKMRSEKKIIAPSLIEVKLTTTKAQKDKIELNAKQKIVNGKLVLEDPRPLPTDTTEEREALKAKLKAEAENAQSIDDLKNIINQLLA